MTSMQEFVSKAFSVVILVLAAISMTSFAMKWVNASQGQQPPSLSNTQSLSPRYIVIMLFVSNFIGVAFARTLQYQVGTDCLTSLRSYVDLECS